jgi:hypothetical protein
MADLDPTPITLEFLGARVAALTADVHDLKLQLAGFGLRLGALEGRFAALEGRFGLQEERLTRVLALVVRIAERIDVPGR